MSFLWQSGICIAYLALPGNKIITLSHAHLERPKIQVEEENKPPTTVYLNISANSIHIPDQIFFCNEGRFVNDGELILSSFSLFWWSPWLLRCSLWPEIDTPSSSYGKIAALWKLFPKCSEALWNNTADFAVFPGPQGWQPRIRYLKRDKKKVLPPFTHLLWIQHNVCVALFCPSAQAGQVDRGSRQFCENWYLSIYWGETLWHFLPYKNGSLKEKLEDFCPCFDSEPWLCPSFLNCLSVSSLFAGNGVSISLELLVKSRVLSHRWRGLKSNTFVWELS